MFFIICRKLNYEIADWLSVLDPTMRRVFHVFRWPWHSGEVIDDTVFVLGLSRKNVVLIQLINSSKNQVSANFYRMFIYQYNHRIYVLVICAR